MLTPVPPGGAPAPPDDDAFSEADGVWFERLAGRAPAEGQDHGEALAEAERVRLALDAQERDMASNTELAAALTPQRTEAQLQALYADLRRERLLPPDAGAKPRWPRWRPLLGWSMAAAVAAFLVVPLLPMDGPTYDEPPVYRGEMQLVRRTAMNPPDAAKALDERLKMAGANSQIYRRGNTMYVDIVVPEGLSERLAQALREEALAATPGRVRIEITRPK